MPATTKHNKIQTLCTILGTFGISYIYWTGCGEEYRGDYYSHRISLVPAWRSNYIYYHMWNNYPFHDDVNKWKHFPRYWPFVRGIHRSPVNSPHKGQWRGALIFTLIWARINSWVNNCEAGDLRRNLAHYDVIVMPNFQRCNRGSLGMDKLLHPTLYWLLSHMQGLKLLRVCKRCLRNNKLSLVECTDLKINRIEFLILSMTFLCLCNPKVDPPFLLISCMYSERIVHI